MWIRRALLAASLLSSAACALPGRENPFDPNNRVNAVISLRVDGVESSIAGRGRGWVLDGSASASPSGPVVSHAWELADRAAPAPDDESITWLALDSASAIASTATTANGVVFSAAFRSRLLEITDFGVTGVGSTTRFARLTVEDSEGSRDSETVLLTIENHAPTLSLGPDLRVSPGGKWWNLAAGADVLGAEPMTETLTLIVTDPDLDEELAASDLAPARWRVFGALALTLDLDRDTLVDDANFAADPSHRTISFDAPVYASRNSFSVDASDLGDVASGAISTASVDLRVDVLTNAWVFDRGAAQFARLDSSRFETTIAVDTRPIASDGRRALVGEQGASVNLRVVDQSLRDVRRLNATPFDAIAYLTAASDGADGWWVLQGGAGADMGTLRHLSPNGAALVIDRTVKTVEGGATSEFQGGGALPVAPTMDGSKDVWALGQTDSVGASRRLYRIKTNGSLVSAQDVGSAAGMTTDGAGGVYIMDGLSLVTHLDAQGAVIDTFQATGSSLVAYDSVRQVLWTVYDSNYDVLFRRAADGTVLSFPAATEVDSIYVDETDGSVIVAGAYQAIYRVGLDATGVALEVRETVPIGLPLFGNAAVLNGGTLLALTQDFSGNRRLVVVEAGTGSPQKTFTLAASPIETGNFEFAVDPQTGFLWIWRPATGSIEVRSTAGSLVRQIPVGPPSVEVSARGRIALDPESRRAYVGWTSDGVSSSVSEIDMDDSASVASVVPGSEAATINDLAVIPGGSLCMYASPIGIFAAPKAFVLDPATGIGTAPIDGGSNGGGISVDAATRSCWFFTSFVGRVVRVTEAGASTTFNSVNNPTTGVGLVAKGHADTAQWNGLTYSADTHDVGGSTANWLVTFGPNAGGIAAAATTVPAPEGFALYPSGLVQDPYYRHLWASFGDVTQPSTGAVIRLDANRVEVARTTTGFITPEINALH